MSEDNDNSNNKLDELLTPDEVADLLKIKKQTLAEWRLGRGEISLPFVKLGRHVRYERSVVLEFIRSRTRRSTRS